MEPFGATLRDSFGGSLGSVVALEAAAFALLAAGAISLLLALWARDRPDDAQDGPTFGPGRGPGRGPGGGPASRTALRDEAGADPAARPAPGVLGFLLGGVLGAALGLRAGRGGRRFGRGRAKGAPAAPAAFLFEDGRLVDASPEGRRLLRGVDRRGGDLKAVLGLLARRFGPDLPERLAALAEGERASLPAKDGAKDGAGDEGAGVLEAAREDGALRLVLGLAHPEEDMGRLALEAALAELAHLRALAEDAPGPIWALDGAGAPAWANRAYLDLADLAQGGPRAAPAPSAFGFGFGFGQGPDHRPPERARASWPARPLFEPPPSLADGQSETRRVQLQLPGKPEPEWFDVFSVRRGAGSVHFATDVGRLVGAEASRSTFVQTLSKAFAHLAVGLAVFDRQRRLVLFNPAFADLTGLSFPFLSGRPLVHTVLDRLREAQVLPEPRNYASWREGVAALEAKASAGHLCETWTLPDGRTYRVTGKPHPDGALAFLVEDITDEIALARRVNAELDTARAVLDSLEEGVAVFTAAGTLSLSNRAYDALRGEAGAVPGASSQAPPGEALVGLADAGLWDELDRWERLFGRSALWDAIRGGRVPREGAAAELPGPDGRALLVRATPLPGGGLAVGFSARGGAAPVEEPVALDGGGAEEAPARPARAAR